MTRPSQDVRGAEPVTPSRRVSSAHDGHYAPEELREGWSDRTRIVLSPIAAPSILGLYGFFAATVMVGSNLAGWWGTPMSLRTVFPFALVFGGVAQLLAAMWAYRARDGLATAVHGAWGSFWIAYGILYFLFITGTLVQTPLGTADPAFGFWFVGLAAITGMVALGALSESLGTFVVTVTLAVGSGFFAAGLWAGNLTADRIAGWLFVVSAAAAWYTASAMMLAGTTGRTILPLGKYSKAANIPSKVPTYPIEFEYGEPGVKAGQ